MTAIIDTEYETLPDRDDSVGWTAVLRDLLDQLPEPRETASLAAYLPFLFKLKGKPLTLAEHFPIDPMYHRRLPREAVYKCARQVGKSTNICAANLLSSIIQPYFQTLFVTPRFETARRLSSNSFRPLLAESPVRRLFTTSKCENSVLQKTLANNAMIHFSFALLDCDRCRGLSVDRVNYDEVQDLDPSFIPVISETMTASKEWGMACYTGTPKTLDNTIETLWRRSSQGEWVVPCDCGHYNIADVDYDLEAMLGPARNVELAGTGLICAKCRQPVAGERGFWLHRFPDRVPDCAGYHIPQPVLPLHYRDAGKWADLLHKRDHYPRSTYLNECLGVSCDQGVKLISLSDLHRAAQLEWSLEEAPRRDYRNRYQSLALGVDWGGRGVNEVSTTAAAVVGVRPDGVLEVVYLERFPANHSDEEELLRLALLYRTFRCDLVAHDFVGAGRKADTLLRQAGFAPDERIMPMAYTATGARNLVTFSPPRPGNLRPYYTLDKTWSLSLLLHLIRVEQALFPRPDPRLDELFQDFLSLITEKHERNFTGDVFLIKRGGKTPDDAVHAVNFAAMALFHAVQRFPDIAGHFRSSLARTRDLDETLHPGRDLTRRDWRDSD